MESHNGNGNGNGGGNGHKPSKPSDAVLELLRMMAHESDFFVVEFNIMLKPYGKEIVLRKITETGSIDFGFERVHGAPDKEWREPAEMQGA